MMALSTAVLLVALRTFLHAEGSMLRLRRSQIHAEAFNVGDCVKVLRTSTAGQEVDVGQVFQIAMYDGTSLPYKLSGTSGKSWYRGYDLELHACLAYHSNEDDREDIDHERILRRPVNASGEMEGSNVIAQTESAYGNVCDHGKLLPEFYLLGTQKAGTTTLSMDMESVGIEHTGDWKEFHFFDKLSTIGTANDDLSVQQMRGEWLQMLPPCPQEKRRVAADFTPSNLRSVPLPAGTLPTGSHWGLYFLRARNSSDRELAVDLRKEGSLNIPRTLRMLYPLPFARRLTFAVTLREGLARMQSAWYSASTTDETDKTLWLQCSDCAASSFHEALERTLTKAEAEPPVYDDWLWTSMYARQLAVWAEYFRAGQFFIIPYRKYVDGTLKETVCNRLMLRLGYKADCSKLKARAEQLNAHTHPPLLQDATPRLIGRYDRVMSHEKHRLVQLLAEFHVAGATLFDFRDSLSAKQHQQKSSNASHNATIIRLAQQVDKWLLLRW